MDARQAVGLLAIGLAAGVASGMFGIGGGVIIVPALTLFLAFEPLNAIATSLAALLLPVGILAVTAYYRAGLMRVRSAALVAAGLVLTVVIGAQIAINLPSNLLKQIYSVFLIYMGWRLAEPRQVYAAWRARQRPGAAAPQADAPDAPVREPNVPWYWLLLLGMAAGVASGMFGIGGGIIIVPALVGLFKYDQKLAVGTSLGALLLPVGLPGVIVYYQAGAFDVATAALVALGLALGALAGARIALNLPSRTVRRLYGLFLLAVALRFIFGG
ncbi:MAG: sulfite exporter TauE/SafE family protein [Aggregatilineales bacterium]